MDKTDNLCLCFPCIIYYFGGYVQAHKEHQVYPVLQEKGFTPEQQKAIAEEWYWVSFERESAVNDYLRGYVNFRDGHWWRLPPSAPAQKASTDSTPSSMSSRS